MRNFAIVICNLTFAFCCVLAVAATIISNLPVDVIKAGF